MTNLTDKVLAKNNKPFDVMSVIFSNFALVSEKQKKPKMEQLFSLLSESCRIQAKKKIQGAQGTAEMQRLLQEELGGRYNEGLKKAGELGDVDTVLDYSTNPLIQVIKGSR